MGKKRIKIQVPDIEYLDDRFEFIKNPILKENLTISLQYVVFLVKVETDFETTGAVKYSIFKNAIQYTASIVEGVMHYGLEFAIQNGIVNEGSVMPKMDTYTEKKLLYKIDPYTQIMGVKQVKKFEKFKKNTQFKTVCDAYKKGKLIDSDLLKSINELREKRNKIHLAGLKKIEDDYTKDDIAEAFNVAFSAIIEVGRITTTVS